YGLPDLDPNTGRIRCDTIFNAAIDALEAAGAIVIWSAGNEGEDGVTSPANRARTPVDAFAVGAVDASGQAVASSGRGPSACGGPNAVKPDVAAPGSNVRTRSRFNQYTTVTGTSFSTPMVGGVLALMRSKNPTITPEMAKTILLDTATDLGAAGDDNQTGRGLVDAAAAVAAVQRPTQPLARLVGYRPAGVPAGKLVPAGIEDALILRPGGSHSLVPVLTNHGPALPASTGRLSSPTPGVTVSRSSVPLASAATGAFFGPAGGETFGVDVGSQVPPGTPIVLVLAVDGAAVGPFRLVVKAGEPIEGGFATHDVGQVRLSVTNFGGLGYYTGLHGRGFVLEGTGFRYPPTSPNWLFHAGFLAGTGPARLSDDVPYGEDTQGASDWIPLFGFPIRVDAAAGGQRISTAYDDRKAFAPLGLEVRQESFAFADPEADDFVLVQYVITNRTSQAIGGLRFGLFADWDLPGASGLPSETAGWDPARRLGFVEGAVAGQPALGVMWLDAVSGGQITYHVLTRDEVAASTKGNPALAPARALDPFGGEFSDAEKWDALTSGQTRTSVTQPQDLYQVIGVGPVTIGPGATDTVAVALVGGATRAALQANADAARTAYFERVLGTAVPPPPEPPGELALDQNFPNPFRIGGATTIVFGIPDGADGASELAVYDALGRRVRTLARDLAPGEQAAAWDGRDESGSSVPPGVYVVRLIAAGGERTIRVLVLP
ncbi:MAG TPA: S8 family serine peptidase, partial [Gemmatimonadota bacterium]|nr:S8 family serine peptidase [Gemmatimonadota bacterium]